ncbi:phosphoribosylamine--glycine ligase [Kordiimonas laminariae]|uniref:phosphoribosylamine--glycine ligase n=1 Tax=Kordiimonas laminariae TaxID=2917717 RepID=UPI001FF40B5F|nr:phosphoribosylamine--glycine ligase [Kordiimonas laminariae]MCK0068218.1 phosphoribosylamine--glycine ligase [Kordiimonas laminariae]
MNILLIGSGGREHALAWKIAQSPLLKTLYCAPGNGGIADVANCVTLDAADHGAVIEFCRDHEVDLVVVGPEAPLVAGLVNDLKAADILAFGPTKGAAQLEGSKGFTKDMCAKYGIPTAAYGRFEDPEFAKDYIRKQGAPIVIKADGLAAGKGVIIAQTLDEALDAVDYIFDGAFGDAGAEVVVEEFMTGEEASFFALCDGVNTLALATAQDHKAVGEGDTGPNTGGMGAYSPAPVMTDDMCERVMKEIILPTTEAMADMGHPYTGVFFAGLMITDTGPKLIEYNCRFGDPECQVLMSRLDSDIIPLLEATANGTLAEHTASWNDKVALTVVMAANGYPSSYQKGTEIRGLTAAEATGAKIFHAGTKQEDGHVLAVGGRVLNVTALGETVTEAQAKAYTAVDTLKWDDGFCRRDIGWRAVAREKA